jgi:glycosyltransferase involved in cell wall biosynthesis
LFPAANSDPWAVLLAGNFADAFIFADHLSFFLPIPKSESAPLAPALIKELISRDSDTIHSHEYGVFETPRLLPAGAEQSLQTFNAWVQANPRKFRKWIALHRTPHIKKLHADWIGPGYFYDFGKLKESDQFAKIRLPKGITENEYVYAFDVALRYYLYGAMLPEDAPYLAHPIRCLPPWAQLSSVQPVETPIPFSFQRTIAAMAPNLDLPNYAILLHEARGLVRNKNLHLLGPGGVEKEELRDIAMQLKLPPRIKRLGWKAQVIVSLIAAGLGAISGGAAAAAAASAFVTLGGQVWDKKTLPSAFSGLGSKRWLNWAVKWDIEEWPDPLKLVQK